MRDRKRPLPTHPPYSSGETVNKKHAVFPLVIDYGKTIEETITLGNYALQNNSITSRNFPIERENAHVKVISVLVHFERPLGTQEIIDELHAMGCRPADIRELLVFGAGHPKIQHYCTVVALGSQWKNGVPCLSKLGNCRCLTLLCIDAPWNKTHHFLAVHQNPFP